MSEIEIPQRDAQYGDAQWRENPFYRRLAQSHIAWAEYVDDFFDDETWDWERRERARYLSRILTGAISPANYLFTNPAATKKAIDTAGLSLLKGARNFVRDAITNRGLPRMADTEPFKVGENVGCTKGAVVHREEMFEILQYSPTTATVRQRPLLFVPPQIGRHYILDLTPGQSMVEHAVNSGMQTFMLVWKNPQQGKASPHGWGIDQYVAALARAFEVVRAISGADDLNLVGFCAGGSMSALTQAHLAAEGRNPIHSATYLVTMIDTRKPNLVTTLATRGIKSLVGGWADKDCVIDAKTIAHNFAWMRPKDLVFGNLINSWLRGEDLPAYDLLAWNDDVVNIPAAFIRDSLALMSSGDLIKPNTATVQNTPIDLSKVTADSFVVAAQTDHITTWEPCYMTTQALGGDSEMVLVNKGHIQTIVSPVAKSRQKFWTAKADESDPLMWLGKAEQKSGSWWTHWTEWIQPRSGDEITAPTNLGSTTYPPREAAPGTYVHEK
nr:poly-beta-hydroxybutyrate polymerase [Hoyosella altamirensis]